ncbi:MAG: cell division protein FtsQ/DivIB [Pseudomonadota bacterium]
MKRNRRKIKKTNAVRRKNSALQSFSLRDAWDVVVVIVLLIIIVYFSTIVRNNHHFVAAWPVIKNVNILGNVDAVDRDALKAIIRNYSVGGFFRLKMDQLEIALENLTWVHQASVQRYWPSTVSVKISQHVPIARWGDTGLMNIYGDLYFPDDLAPFQALPMLFGEEERAKELARTFENSVQKLKLVNLQLRALFEDERQSKHFVLSEGLVISIGDGDVSQKINRFITAYDQYLASNIAEVKKIDLRYPNGLAIEWKSPHIAQNLNLHSTEPNL